MKYTIKYSARKTMQIEINRQAELIVRAPVGTPQRTIDAFLQQHEEWIRVHCRKRMDYLKAHPEPDEREKQELIRAAKAYLPQKTYAYAERMRVKPTGVKITSARMRFGSCNQKNGICYSWRLMRYPQEAIDYVIVHELAHILHKNHSREFYRTIEKYMPDYKTRKALLKD